MNRRGNAGIMPDFVFRMMVYFMKIEDLFERPCVLLKRVPLQQGMTVVDYACGPGRYTIPVAEIVGPSGRVYAVDNQHLAVEMTRKKAEKRSLTTVRTILVDSFNTGIPDSVADVVLLIDALALINDRVSLFKEIYRLIKPEGLLFLDPTHMRIATAKNIIEATGLFDIAKFDKRRMLLTKKEHI
jgi:ubiquinone/menaquinone biosynthesis C-methylase UbiE